jgi:hypothetical protein
VPLNRDESLRALFYVEVGMTEWKNERPAWCLHQDCRYRLRAQDAACVGYLPEPAPHDEDFNIYRICLCGVLPDGKVFDLQFNDTDIYHFKRLFEALQRGPSDGG